MDGRSRVHAVIGQPLAIVLPLNFSGAPASGVEVQVSPAPGLPDAEEAVAETVQASYDPLHSVIRLSTARRVVVPAISLHLAIITDSFVVSRDFDVLIDLPDFNRQFDRGEAPDADEDAAAPGSDNLGLGTLILHSQERHTALFGDASASDGDGLPNAARPSATPPPSPRPVRRPDSYTAHNASTLPASATHLARTHAVQAAAPSPALDEPDPRAFPAAAPELPPAGLPLPDTVAVRSAPPGPGAAFMQYLRHPLGDWKLPVSFGATSPDPGTPNNGGSHGAFFRTPLTVLGIAAALLALALLARKLRPKPALPQSPRPAPRPAARQPPAADPVIESPIEQEIRLRKMLGEQPWRSDLRYQLAQRLFKARDAKGFAEVASGLKAALNEEAWQHVCVMGQELLPADARFRN